MLSSFYRLILNQMLIFAFKSLILTFSPFCDFLVWISDIVYKNRKLLKEGLLRFLIKVDRDWLNTALHLVWSRLAFVNQCTDLLFLVKPMTQ